MKLPDFDKILNSERHKFQEERKVFDLKSDRLSKKVSELERKVVLERKDFERKINVFESEKKSLKKTNFSYRKEEECGE